MVMKNYVVIETLSNKSYSYIINLSASIFLFFTMFILDNWLGSDCNSEPFTSNYVLVTQTNLINIVFCFLRMLEFHNE